MPILTVIAGPNGSGKSTLTQSLEFEGRERLLDPDFLARGLNASNPVAAAITAGREELTRAADYIARAESFAVETTLAGRGGIRLICDARNRGFEIHFAFVCLDSPERCITRVRNRVARGGHFVPDADVRRRYHRSLVNMAEVLKLADTSKIYDNSGDAHRLILIATAGGVVWRAEPFPEWARV